MNIFLVLSFIIICRLGVHVVYTVYMHDYIGSFVFFIKYLQNCCSVLIVCFLVNKNNRHVLSYWICYDSEGYFWWGKCRNSSSDTMFYAQDQLTELAFSIRES